MPLISKPNYNQIFASQAPEQDKPAVFNNYPEGWGPESRPNNGKPTIKGFNYLQQTSDLKDLWILQNGACLPYDESIEYAEGAPVLKDGVIQYKTAGGFKSRDSVTIPTYSGAADGVDPVTGVADGAYFNVRSSNEDSYADEYQNVGGSAVATGKSYPSSQALNEVKQKQIEQEKETARIAVKFLLADDIGLTKWAEFKKPPYTTQEYEQAYNNGVRLTSAIKEAHDAGYGEVVLERGNYPFCYENPTGGTFSANRQGAIKLRDLMSGIKIDLNWSTLFVIFDSVNRSPYDKATSQQPYQLFGSVFEVINARNIQVHNGLIRGDQFNRSWVTGEDKTEQTYGALVFKNAVNIAFAKCTFYGFRGDGIGGSGRGDGVSDLSTWYKGGVDETTGVAIVQAGAYNSGMLTLDYSKIIDGSVQVASSGNIFAAQFRNVHLKAFFYRDDGTYIGMEVLKQTDFLRLPVDCAKIMIVAYDDERTTDTVNYGLYLFLASGTSDGLTITDCVFTQNHRGGISNNAGRSYVERCQFYDIGYQKYNFPDYGDPTRFGIDYENVYMNSLTVKDSYFRNIPQGVLGGVQNLRVENCVFENILNGGTFAYGVNIALFKNNTYRNVSRAFGYQNSGVFLKKTIIAEGNILENSGAYVLVDLHPLVNFEVRGNVFNNSSLIAIGNGNNLIVEGNTFRNPVEPGNYSAAVDIQGALVNSNNTITIDLINPNYNYFAMYSALGMNNNVISNRDNITRFREPLENTAINMRGVNFYSILAAKKYQHRLTGKNKGWVSHVDVLNHTDCSFDKVQIEFYGLDGQNFYNTTMVFEDVIFKNTSRIILTKRESASYTTSTTDIVFKNCTIDLTGATQFIFSTYAQLGVCTIKFINCKFIANTPVSLALIQGQTSNITAVATGCEFINVTNTDNILQINGTAKTTFDPPSIAAGATEVTTVTLTGASVGSLAQASFSQYNAAIEIDAVVSAPNTVTVRFKNTSADPVDLPIGTLTVKLI